MSSSNPSSPSTPPIPPSPQATPASALSVSTSPSAALTDAVLMRRAGADVLSLALMEARNHTLLLFAQYQRAMESSDFRVPAGRQVAPPLWTLGRIGWFQEWWVARNMQRAQGRRGAPGQSRLASIEPEADRWWQAPSPGPASQRGPDAAAVRAYLLGTLEATLELLEKTARSGESGAANDDALYFYRLCLFHEDMQGEMLARGAQALGIRLERALQVALTPPAITPRDALVLPATDWRLGHDAGEGGFTFDNESAGQRVPVPECEIDAQPVSWAQYVEFVGDGGYDDEAFWHPEGWQWLQRQAGSEGRRGPRYVEQIGIASGAVMQTRFGQATRMSGQQPALHVSWWEADAWCRWAGRRLPGEAEWELAAHTASRRGFRWGDVWEWTASSFRPWPGFEAGPVADYSQPSFGSHKVLRGGSFATRGRLKHPKFRAFELPGCDDVFAGFRSCAV